jgi:GH18 family chitinase
MHRSGRVKLGWQKFETGAESMNLYRWMLVGVIVLAAHVSASPARAVDLIGYLPNYRMTDTNYIVNTLPDQLEMLDEIRYFGITVNSNGTLTTNATHLANIQTIRDKIATLPEAQRPRLGITLGGFGTSANFPTVAANSILRATLAQNVKSLMDGVGATSVDVDWEHPSGATQVANYALLMKRIKEEVGAGGDVSATMTPTIFMPNSVFEGPHGIDGISLMTYDLGFFGNDPNNPHNLEHSLPEYVVDSIDAWTSPPSPIPAKLDWFFTSWGNSTPAERLGVGLPFYGRDVVDDMNSADEDARTYSQLVTGGSTSDGNYFTYAGEQLWLPGLDLVEERVEFAHANNLRDIIIWELFQDLPPTHEKSLLRRAYETNQSLIAVPGDYDGDGSVGASDYNLWKSTYGSTEGDMRADGNEDGIVDAIDYTFWRNLMAPSDGAGGMSLVVPEPASVAFAMTLLAMFLVFQRVR